MLDSAMYTRAAYTASTYDPKIGSVCGNVHGSTPARTSVQPSTVAEPFLGTQSRVCRACGDHCAPLSEELSSWLVPPYPRIN